jgi:hypothetical protein
MKLELKYSEEDLQFYKNLNGQLNTYLNDVEN